MSFISALLGPERSSTKVHIPFRVMIVARVITLRHVSKLAHCSSCYLRPEGQAALGLYDKYLAVENDIV